MMQKKAQPAAWHNREQACSQPTCDTRVGP